MSYVISVLYIIIMTLWVWFKPLPLGTSKDRLLSLLFLCIKLLSGLILLWVYTYYYEDTLKSDMYRFFNDGIRFNETYNSDSKLFWFNWLGISNDFDYGGSLFSLLDYWVHPYGNQFYNDNRMVIRVHAFLAFFTDKSILTHTLLFSFIAFIGIRMICAGFSIMFKIPFNRIWIVAFFFPGVLVWVSGAMKETLVVIFLAIMVYSLGNLLENNRNKKLYYFLFFMGSFFLWYTKFYVLLCFGPGLIGYYIYKKYSFSFSSFFLGIFLTYTVPIVFSPLLTDVPYWIVITGKYNNFIQLAISENSGSLLSKDMVSLTFTGFLGLIPFAIWNTMFEPILLWFQEPIIYLLPLIEVLLMWIAIGISLYRFKVYFVVPEYVFVLFLLLLFFLIIGLTTPVFGGIFRYKVPIWILFWAGWLVAFNRSKDSLRFNKKKLHVIKR
jgi:hypothetical protein